jgi:TRAP transporter TAXI family solute receptor
MGLGRSIFVGAVAILAAASAAAQNAKVFRIGTGGAQGTYFPIGKLIAEALTERPRGPGCEDAIGCGVPGLIAVAQVSNGSVANVTALAEGKIEAGLAQSDVAYWSQKGEGVFGPEKRFAGLRAIAHLYPESIHVAVRKESAASSIRDLKGLRIAIDEPGSGTLLNSLSVLSGYGLTEKDVKAEYVKPHIAMERIKEKRLDGFFIVAGWPTPAVGEFVAAMGGTLLPIGPPEADGIRAANPFLSTGLIPAEAYPGVKATPTLEVGALLVVSDRLDANAVFGITRALWSSQSLAILRQGHPKGALITPGTALAGVGIPLHPGAERHYREAGLLR